MIARTGRQRAIAKALTLLLPAAPYADIEKIRAEALALHLKSLPAYETLLAEGYDRDSARFFVIDEINRTLTAWRATRLLDPDDTDA